MASFRGALALTHRTLREDVRLARSHLMRLLLLAAIYLSLWSAHSASPWASAPGLEFFTFICWFNFAFITLGAVGFFSSAITEEKEDETLPLLKLADLGAMSILLGKALPRLTTALLLLSAQFPFTMLAVTLGGVSLPQIVAAYFSQAAYLLLAASVGLAWSVLCRRSISAGVMTILTLAALLGLPWLVFETVDEFTSPTGKILNDWPHQLGTVLRDTTIVQQLIATLASGFSGRPLSLQVWSNTLLAAAVFCWTWRGFERWTADRVTLLPAPEKSAKQKYRADEPLPAWEQGALAGAFTLGTGPAPSAAPGPRKSRVWRFPLWWKEYYFGAGGQVGRWARFGLALVAILGTLLAMALSEPAFGNEELAAAHLVIGCLLLALEISLLASRVLRNEIREQTLSSLAMLPCSLGLTTYAKVGGGLLGTWPALMIIAFGFGCVPARCHVDWRGVGMLAALALLAWHLTVYLSLFFRRGALPVAIALTVVATIGFFSLADIGIDFLLVGHTPLWDYPDLRNSLTQEFAIAFMRMLLVVCLGLHPLIGARLRRLAAL